MSDGKEVKRWETISIDTKIPGTWPDVDGVPRVTVVSASDHDRIVAELKQTVSALGRMNDPNASYRDTLNNKLQETIAELRAEVEALKSTLKYRDKQVNEYWSELEELRLNDPTELKETIATQARVIEKLKEQRDAWIWGAASSNKDRCRELVAIDDKELAAIERGES